MTLRTDDKIAEDGQTVRVSVMVMDSMQRAVTGTPIFSDPMIGHRPGYVPITDQDRLRRSQQQMAYDAAVSDRWRGPSSDAAPAAIQTGDARARAYAAYEQRLTNAWRPR